MLNYLHMPDTEDPNKQKDNQSEGKELAPLLELIEPQDITRHSSFEEIVDADMEITNNVLKALFVGFTRVRSIGSICKLTDTTMNVLERRRKLLGKPYGATDLQDPKAIESGPID